MKTILLFICSLLAAAALQAQIIHVPGDYPTIQQGINAANPGDTILVSDGIYFEQVSFLGKKPLMVASQFLMDGDASHIANTIIDGGLLANMDSASVVYFISGEDTTSILCGFTIQHGKGTYTSTFLERDGGGIWISGAGAKIIHNHITLNIVNDTAPVNGINCFGGGISTDYESTGHWVVIANNVIDSNRCTSVNATAAGGGIATFYCSRIVNNIITGNTSTNTGTGTAQGGGMMTAADTGWTANKITIIQDNTFSGNNVSATTAWDGATSVYETYLLFLNNTVQGNRVESPGALVNVGVGGLGVVNLLEGSRIANNIFRENYCQDWGGAVSIESHDPWIANPPVVTVENNYFLNNEAGGIVGALNNYHCPVLLQNNVFTGNKAVSYSVGYFHQVDPVSEHWAKLINNSFANNTAPTNNVSMRFENTNPLIMNCILWHDTTINPIEVSIGYGFAEIAYSDIDTNAIMGNMTIGPGIINVDPLFSDTTSLMTNNWSPCVDQGAESWTCPCGDTHHCPGYDITGVVRPVGLGYDMGAYDLKYWGQGIGTITNDQLTISNYPNPFTCSVTFGYTLKEPSNVTIRVYNSFGQMVAQPVNMNQSKGEQKVLWNAGNLPAGLYFYRIEAEEKVGTGKMVKI